MRLHNADQGARIIQEEIGRLILIGAGAEGQAHLSARRIVSDRGRLSADSRRYRHPSVAGVDRVLPLGRMLNSSAAARCQTLGQHRKLARQAEGRTSFARTRTDPTKAMECLIPATLQRKDRRSPRVSRSVVAHLGGACLGSEDLTASAVSGAAGSWIETPTRPRVAGAAGVYSRTSSGWWSHRTSASAAVDFPHRLGAGSATHRWRS